jgi:phosphoserine phosphatase
MATLYLIRHGETEYNRLNIVQGGGIDSDLNATGIAQGKAFFERYRNEGFDKVYCTQLKRTHQTVHYFESIGHTVEQLPELNEFGWGNLEGVEGTDEVRAQFQTILEAWRGGNLHARVDGGESPLEAWARAEPGIARILRETPPGGKALICAHGRIMRVVLAQMLGYGLTQMDLFPHHNTALNKLNWSTNGRFRILKLNDTSHLQ